MKKKYNAPVFNKYLSIFDVTNVSIPHGSNVSEGTNATYNVSDCFDAKAKEDEYLQDQYCLEES